MRLYGHILTLLCIWLHCSSQTDSTSNQAINKKPQWGINFSPGGLIDPFFPKFQMGVSLDMGRWGVEQQIGFINPYTSFFNLLRYSKEYSQPWQNQYGVALRTEGRYKVVLTKKFELGLGLQFATSIFSSSGFVEMQRFNGQYLEMLWVEKRGHIFSGTPFCAFKVKSSNERFYLMLIAGIGVRYSKITDDLPEDASLAPQPADPFYSWTDTGERKMPNLLAGLRIGYSF